MKPLFGVLSFFLISGLLHVSAQKELNYMPKELSNELRKAGVSANSAIVEIKLPDFIQQSNRIHGKFFIIKENEESKYRYIYVGRVNSCRAGSCPVSGNKRNKIETEYFDYYILFNNNKTIVSIRVFNYQATHGHEITAKGWLKQFIGHDGTVPLQVSKNIDAISGATISVNAITADVEMKTALLKNIPK